ncbi:hypothetical protein VPH35_111058 [Triticum aestivum]
MSGAASWTSPSTSATGSSGEALHHRDRRDFLAYGCRCPAPDLPHRSSFAMPAASSASPTSRPTLMPLSTTTSTTTPPCQSNQAIPLFDHPNIAHSILSCLH